MELALGSADLTFYPLCTPLAQAKCRTRGIPAIIPVRFSTTISYKKSTDVADSPLAAAAVAGCPIGRLCLQRQDPSTVRAPVLPGSPGSDRKQQHGAGDRSSAGTGIPLSVRPLR